MTKRLASAPAPPLRHSTIPFVGAIGMVVRYPPQPFWNVSKCENRKVPRCVRSALHSVGVGNGRCVDQRQEIIRHAAQPQCRQCVGL